MTFLKPVDVPMGFSPRLQNVRFLPRAFTTREGLTSRLNKNVPYNGLAQFIDNLRNKTLITFDANGSLDFQDRVNPAQIDLLMSNAADAGSVMASTAMFGREFLSFYNSDLSPGGPIRHWDGVRQSVAPLGILPTFTAADSATAGSWGAGTYEIAVFFESVDHSFLQGSAIVSWTTAGAKQLSLTGLPTGAGQFNVIARWICVSQAGATTLFRFPTLVLLDNVTTAATFDSPGSDFTKVGAPMDELTMNAVNPPALPHLAPEGPGEAPTAVNSTNVGSIVTGVHGVWVSFETIWGYITAPSPMGQWTATGGKKAIISNIPIGPWYVKARRLFFSAAGLLDLMYVSAFRIPNNTTQAVEVDFTDINLLQGSNFDYLQKNVAMADAIGSTLYGGRMAVWGMLNTIRGMGLNLSFDGGWDQNTGAPMGWWSDTTATGGGSTLGSGGGREVFNAFAGDAYRITSFLRGSGMIWNAQFANITSATESGTTATILLDRPHNIIVGGTVVVQNVGVAGYNGTFVVTAITSNGFSYTAPSGLTSSSGGQILYSLLAPLLATSTAYSISFRARADANITNGTLNIELFSPSVGSLGIVTLEIGTVGQGWLRFENQLLPGMAQIPQDAMLRIYVNNFVLGKRVWVDHIQIFPTVAKFEPSILRLSNPFDPETFDGINGFQSISKDNGEAITAVVQLRAFLYILKERSMNVTWDDATNPPALWVVREIDSTVGCGSPRAMVSSNTMLSWSFRAGAYVFTGARPMKVSQEIQTTWEGVNWDEAGLTHTLHDPDQKLIMFFLPLNGSTVLNALILDYSEGMGQEDDPGPRKWGLDLYPNPINGSALFITNDVDHPGAGNQKVLYFAGNKIYENIGTNDDGAKIDFFYETAFGKAGDSGQDLFGGVGYYAEGSGELLVTLIGMDDVLQQPLQVDSISANPGKQFEKYSNTEVERAKVRFEGNTLNTSVTIKAITLFARPFAEQRPN